MSTEATTTAGRSIQAVEWTLESPGRLHRTVTTLPRPAAGEVLVATRLGAISPGAERALVHGSSPRVSDRQYPWQPGGLNVVAIHDAEDRTLLGDRGVATLGHRDFALVPYARFVRIPPGVSDEVALLGILAADARHAIEVAAVEAVEDCLVVGGGIVGTLAAWELASRTTGALRIVEQDGPRRELLKRIRFPREIRIAERAGRARYHTTFDCANSAAGFRTALAATRRGGSVVVVSDGGHEKYELSAEFFANELYLGKTGAHPDLRGFLNDWFARGEDRSSLVEAAFQETVRFDEFPQAYLKSVLATPEERQGLLPRVVY